MTAPSVTTSNRRVRHYRRGSPLWLNVQIQKAFALNSLDRVDDAKVLLEKIIAKIRRTFVRSTRSATSMRSHERYAEARDYYTRAIALIGKPTKENWTLFYARGVSQRAAEGLAGRRRPT